MAGVSDGEKYDYFGIFGGGEGDGIGRYKVSHVDKKVKELYEKYKKDDGWL